LNLQPNGVHKYTISNHLQLSHFTQATYHTEVSDDVGMLVGFPEQLHLTVREAEALRQQALHRHLPMVKHTSTITQHRQTFVNSIRLTYRQSVEKSEMVFDLTKGGKLHNVITHIIWGNHETE